MFSGFAFLLVAVAATTTPLPAPTPVSAQVDALIKKAEAQFYAFGNEDRLAETDRTLIELEKIDPKNPYVYWARARTAFWRKDMHYTEEIGQKGDPFREKKLSYAKDCHDWADRCIEIAPKNAECRLMKGACYSMQASTWGQTYQTLRILRPMDKAWKMATELPSDFVHYGELNTAQLALVMRAVLYRLIPDSFWFWVVTRLRGDRAKAYEWLKANVTGRLRQEMMTFLELAAGTLCYGYDGRKPEIIAEGMAYLKEGETLAIRNASDKLDLLHLEYLKEHPEKACAYRRERFEEISTKTLKKTIGDKPTPIALESTEKE